METRSSSRRCLAWCARPATVTSRTADDPGSPCGPARPARSPRAWCDRARRGLGKGLSAKRHRRARAGGLGPAVAGSLATLVRKDLVRPVRAGPGDDVSLSAHADQGRRLRCDPQGSPDGCTSASARWLEQHGGELVELDEIPGLPPGAGLRVPEGAGAGAGRQARSESTRAPRKCSTPGRSCGPTNAAAVSLLGRASSLVPDDRIEQFEFDLVEADANFDLESAERRAHRLAQRAAGVGDELAELSAQALEAQVRLLTSPVGATGRLEALATELVERAKGRGDDFALFLGYSALAWVCHMRALYDDELDLGEQAAAAARQLKLRHLESAALQFEGPGRSFGSKTPVPEVLAWVDARQAAGLRHRSLQLFQIDALFMAGRFDEARAVVSEASANSAERGVDCRPCAAQGTVRSQRRADGGRPRGGRVGRRGGVPAP